MKKRTFTYVLALITIVCLLASSASATAPDTLNGDTIQRRLLCLCGILRRDSFGTAHDFHTISE